MTEKNYFGRLLAILFVTLIACVGLYLLPDKVLGFTLKKVDLLSDVRVRNAHNSIDKHDALDDKPLLPIDSLLISDTTLIHGLTAEQLLERDSAYRLLSSASNTDSTQVRIEDFSAGYTGLRHFFSALNQIHSLERPVRIAFMGDSFIEGDIILADFRARMQERFGGGGVGFVPVSSKVEQYRPTISQTSKGWKTSSILSERRQNYVLPCVVFEPVDDEASISFKTVNTYPGLDKVSSLKLIFSRNEQSEMKLIFNHSKDTVFEVLPETESITQYETEGSFTDGVFYFRNAKGLQALGIALEENTGVVVDNFSLRGNSGIVLDALDLNSCRTLQQIRAYDLIILQYRLNVATEQIQEYGWYRDRMVKVIQHIRQCFPETDILLLSVSDRSNYRDGAYQTMPGVESLLKAQHQAAQIAQVPFWSVFEAMGGKNAMVRYVDRRWASKDYTHLSFRGGKEIATMLFDALIFEKELYDEMERYKD
jgi:lysophospholipase L1-like esterase